MENADRFHLRKPELSEPVIRDLQRMNPWWEGRPMPAQPVTRRHFVEQIHRCLKNRLAPVVAVRGPRQIGKTTAQLQVLQDQLDGGVRPRNILRVQFDESTAIERLEEPLLRIVDWYEAEVLGKTLNEAARDGEPTLLFLDEIQNIRDWAPQLKLLVDHSTTQVLITGSSALRIELGRDSLAGRITTLEAGVLSLTEIAAFRGLDLGSAFLEDNGLSALMDREWWLELREHGRRVRVQRGQVFEWFSARGGYPLAHKNPDTPWEQIADQLNENVIRRVIRHDLRMGDRGRKRDAALLEELFRLACRYAGQSPGTELLRREAERALQTEIGPHRVGNYLRFLRDTLLLRLIEPLEIRLKKSRGNAKICLADHGLRASWLQEIVPLAPAVLAKEQHLATLAGRIAESVVGTALSSVYHLDLAHFPERSEQAEIDFVLTIGTRRIPIEVKYQGKIDPVRDTEGLRQFIEHSVNSAPFGILVTQIEVDHHPDPRIVCLPLSSLMLIR